MQTAKGTTTLAEGTALAFARRSSSARSVRESTAPRSDNAERSGAMTLPHELASAGAPVVDAMRFPLLLSRCSLVHRDATLALRHPLTVRPLLHSVGLSRISAPVCPSVRPAQEVPLAKKIVFSGLSGAIATTCIYPIDIC